MNTKPLTHSKLALAPYNQTVKESYFAILKAATTLLSTLEEEGLRSALIYDNRHNTSTDPLLHEFITPLLYLRLEVQTDNTLAIHWGIEPSNKAGEKSTLTSNFVRMLYKLTAKENTATNIQDAVKTDWFINSPSYMYEYVELRNKHHQPKLIKHKVTTSQRKRLLSVA
jgi:hypothetical protein